jgi:hypothetical protein
MTDATSTSSSTGKSRAAKTIAVGVIAVAAVLASALAGPAGSAAAAGGYDYSPGEPMIMNNGGTIDGGYDQVCSGGYAISGDSGFFLLGANCATVTAFQVRNNQGVFANYLASPASLRDGSSALYEMVPGDDAHQMVADPLTGEQPGDGRIVGFMPTVQQRPGMLVGKMGVGTGWTEGAITGVVGDLLCTTMEVAPGDLGGPVWRLDENGLRALGTIRGRDSSGHGCYRPIQETLYEYGANLPVFGPDQGRPTWGTWAPGMPYLGGTTSAGRAFTITIPTRADWTP